MSFLKPALRNWSFARVLLACAAWFVFGVALIALWVFLQLSWTGGIGSGSGGIGAVSVGISEPVLLVPVVPPLVLLAAWVIVRARR
jgi:hypothetical protein